MADRFAVLTGAGISTASGIPDFRGPEGLWTKDPAAEAMFDIDEYVASAAVRAAAWKHRLDSPVWTAEPNAAHRALAALQRTGRLTALITQNIDGLHQRAGSTGVLELHGTVHFTDCLHCGRRIPTTEVLPRLEAGETDPACLVCGGILKCATVSFGQSLDTGVLAAATAAVEACDVFLAVGTSLQVYPAAGLCAVARSAGKRLVILNAQPTPYDEDADQVLRTPIETTLPDLLTA